MVTHIDELGFGKQVNNNNNNKRIMFQSSNVMTPSRLITWMGWDFENKFFLHPHPQIGTIINKEITMIHTN